MAEDVELELDDNEDSHLSTFFGGGTSTRSKSTSSPLGVGLHPEKSLMSSNKLSETYKLTLIMYIKSL